MEIQLEIRCDLSTIQGIYIIQVAGSRCDCNTVRQIEHFDAKLAIFAVQIYGEMSSYQTQRNYCRYYLIMSSVPRETLSMQDMVGGDNNRTPVKFQGVDVCRIGAIRIISRPRKA